ncbi:four helix bundle protein [Planctomicrobium piriforme]|uniref:Four helix bundle protein n=2 Tax=Planctomicrobium piriforme TaxID=1576369 RepID=A0A1I3DH71_9PLAN|nr:four helix bundle protein [Planctomicrobium piriforme]
MRDFRQFDVWSKAHALTLNIYRQTQDFPQCELYGLTSQIRRSAASVAANIAEGCGRQSDADFARFLNIAAGSVSETEYHLLLAKDLGYLAEEAHSQLEPLAAEVRRMLAGLLRRLQANNNL